MTTIRNSLTQTIASIALAAAATLVMLGGVDYLASADSATAAQSMVQHKAAAPRA